MNVILILSLYVPHPWGGLHWEIYHQQPEAGGKMKLISTGARTGARVPARRMPWIYVNLRPLLGGSLTLSRRNSRSTTFWCFWWLLVPLVAL